MKKLDKVTRVLAKLLEIGHWIAAVSMAVVFVLSFIMGKGVLQNVSVADFGASLTTYGFEIEVVDQAGQVSLTALRIFCVGAVLILGTMAMVFRNIYLILKKSENATPFQKDNVRMVREVGIFLIAVPVISLGMSILARLILGAEMTEVSSVGLSSFMVGLTVLCLSQFFAHGVELETETDGLL